MVGFAPNSSKPRKASLSYSDRRKSIPRDPHYFGSNFYPLASHNDRSSSREYLEFKLSLNLIDHGPQGWATAHVTQEEGWYSHEGTEGKSAPQGLVRAPDLG